MTRADLHNALAVDRDIHEASEADPALLDPVVQTSGGLPGLARPFVVMRAYQGPQGDYIETFALQDSRGNELYRSRPRRISLGGEMFENRFTTTLTGVHLRDGGEHQLSFFVDDDHVGSIPVFIESSTGGDPRTAAEETFRSAVKKGTILWVTVPSNGRRRRATRSKAPSAHTQPAWFVYDSDKIYLFSGPTEQHIPGLGDTDTVELLARSKDIRSLVSQVTADVRVIPPDDARYDEIGKAALSKRLNLRDGADALARWKEHCVLVECIPRFREQEAEQQAAPAATPAATASAPAEGAAASAPAERTEEIHVEAEVDQEVYDRLIGEGQPERVARAKAKAAYVRAERQRLRSEAAGERETADA